MKGTVSGDSTIMTAQDQVFADLEGEAVILNLKSGVYYSLDAVGAFIWNLIQEPKTVNDIRDAILAEYEVEIEHCERDLLALLEKLNAEGLVEIRDRTIA